MRLTFILLFVLVLTSLGCLGSSNEIGEYLDNTQEVVENFTSTRYEVQAMYYDEELTVPQLISRIPQYQSRYNQYLREFEQISYPLDCEKYYDLVIDGMSASMSEIEALKNAAATSDSKYIDEMEKYYYKAQQSFLLAISEWEKLADKAEESGGFRWWYVPVGLVILSIAVSLGSTILFMVLNIGIITVGGVYLAIEGGIKKLTGRR